MTKNQIAHGVSGLMAVVVFVLALSAGIVGMQQSISLSVLCVENMNDVLLLLILLWSSTGGSGHPLYQSLVQAWLIVQMLLDAVLAGTNDPRRIGTRSFSFIDALWR